METEERTELITLAELDEMPQVPGTCAYCLRDTMVYALIEYACRDCVLEDMEAFGEIPARPSAAKPSVQRPTSTLADQRKATCANCRRPISRTGAGADWYHRRNSSTSCYPGSGSRKRAQPCEVA